METLKPDLCVIGAGTGGLAAAAAAVRLGRSVVLIEQGKAGGERLNYGCIPSKALIAAARQAAACAGAPAFGLSAGPVKVDFATLREHIRGVIAARAPDAAPERYVGLGIRFIAGAASFTDRETVAVGEDTEVKARHFVIATGSVPAVPPIPGLKDVPFLTSETVFDLDACPAHLVVIGAGTTGLELAQAFRRLGAAVTMLEAARPLADADPECAEVVLDQFAREGIVLRTGVEVLRVAHEPDKVHVTISAAHGSETITGSHLLVATGRSPNLGGLDLAAAHIKHDAGGIAVDRQMRTSNRAVYAIGDVAGGRFSHEAAYHAGVVIKAALLRQSVKAVREIPWTLFTDPELAQAGLTEAAAKQRGQAIRVLRCPYHDNDRAQAERATRGHIKVLTSPRGQILGATIVGAAAGELIAIWALAIQRGLDIGAVADLVVPTPTLAEIGPCAVATFASSLTGATGGRIMKWLRR